MDRVGDMIALGALRSPDRVAVKALHGPVRTYAELDRRTNQLAQALLDQGLRPGDRIASWMENGVEYVELYLAAAKAGLVIASVNARFKHREAEFQIRDSGAVALFITPELAEETRQLPLDALPELIVTTGPVADPATHTFEDLLAAGRPEAPTPPSEDDLYIIGYTSGTTGPPKGAMLTHRSVKNIARANAVSYRLPLYSIGAFNASMSFVASTVAFMMTHFYLGGSVILMPGWDAARLVDVIENERVTYTSIPSPVLDLFADEVAKDPSRVSSLVSVLHASSKAKPEKVARLAGLLGDRFLEGWGMTENSGGLLTATTRDDVTGRSQSVGDVFSSVGRAVVDTVVEVLAEDGTPMPHDGSSVGELVGRSAALMAGYWNNPGATADTLRDDGWYHTGDLGTMDAQGYVYISDRRTDLIISGGMNVYPSEVEQAINELPEVADCVVVGLPHERWGQTVVAVVQPVDASADALSAEQVINHCRSRLASYKKPTRVIFMTTLPYNAAGKVVRRTLREAITGSDVKA